MRDQLFVPSKPKLRKSNRGVEQPMEAPAFSAAFRPLYSTTVLFRFALAGLLLSVVAAEHAAAESDASELVIRQTMSESCAVPKTEPPQTSALAHSLAQKLRLAAPLNAAAYSNQRLRTSLLQAQSREQEAEAPPATPQLDLAKNPCAAMDEKPLGELGIGIALPAGQLPDDPASACWNELNAASGPFPAIRCWPTAVYNWNATCLCYRPLYFEEINLERYGYGCCETLQPLASAAHFFGTVPALPYCMAVECPCKCVYTLGHYRPGSCPPKRYHWPPCSPLAAAAEGGVWTGMVFLIP
jgi:hypothetical protein